jgi:hypothetical protein
LSAFAKAQKDDDHPRNIGPLLATLRGEDAGGTFVPISGRQGRNAVSVDGGGAASRALPGNKKALTHGLYTCDAIGERREVQDLTRRSRRLLKEIE